MCIGTANNGILIQEDSGFNAILIAKGAGGNAMLIRGPTATPGVQPGIVWQTANVEPIAQITPANVGSDGTMPFAALTFSIQQGSAGMTVGMHLEPRQGNLPDLWVEGDIYSRGAPVSAMLMELTEKVVRLESQIATLESNPLIRASWRT